MDARADRAARAADPAGARDDRVRPVAGGPRIAAADASTGPRARTAALAYLGILSHPLIDLLNVYGVRLLMPFSERWFYGDALFIIDIWIWLRWRWGFAHRDGARKRGAGAAGAARRRGDRGGNGLRGRDGRGERRRRTSRGSRDRRARTAAARIGAREPGALNPFRRRIIFDTGDAFGFGDLRWTPLPRLTIEPHLVATSMNDPAIQRAAARDRRVKDFLYWSRLPFADIRRTPPART